MIKTKCVVGYGQVGHTTSHQQLLCSLSSKSPEHCTPILGHHQLVHNFSIIPFNFIPQFQDLPKCDFKLDRHSNIYIAMFFADIALFYLIPLVLSVVLYCLIAKMLLYTAPRTLTSQDNNRSNQARLQVTSPMCHNVVQVVKMLIAVVTIFATLWLPWRGLMVYNTVAALYSRQSIFMDLWYLMFAKTCIYINRLAPNPQAHPSPQRYQPHPLQCLVHQVPARVQTHPAMWPAGGIGGLLHAPSTFGVRRDRHAGVKERRRGQEPRRAGQVRGAGKGW